MSAGSLLRVAVGPRFATPLLDYLAPRDGPVPPAGVRVSVPLGKGKRTGIVLERLDGSEVPAERLRPVLDVLDAEPLWDPATLAVLRWAADYYCHPLGQVLAYALPPQLRRGGKLPSAPRHWRASGKAAGEGSGLTARAPKQRKILEELLAAGRTGLKEGSPARAGFGLAKGCSDTRGQGSGRVLRAFFPGNCGRIARTAAFAERRAGGRG